MRTLSIQQPFAQFVVRGIKRIEVRPWGTDYRGRVAIHASAKVPPKAMEKQWRKDREIALRFADQGWLDFDDLKSLPRSAIIGTVELVGVHLGKELQDRGAGLFAWDWTTERMEVAAHDPRTGALKPIESKKRTLAVNTPPDQYAWVFVDPVEIDPITDVAGRHRLWNLVGELEGVIADRETSSRRGWWRPAEVNPARRAKGIRAWKKHWETEREQFVLDVEQEVRMRREIARVRFKPEVEDRVLTDILGYIARNRVPQAAGEGVRVRVEGQFTQMFDGRDIVSADEFELLLRRRLKTEGEERYAAVRAERRKQELLKLYDELEEGARRGPPSAMHDLRMRLEAVAEKSVEEEEEDYEFVRRELYPIGKEKAERAAARKAAKETARREAAARNAAKERARREAAARNVARLAALTPEEVEAELWAALLEPEWEPRKEDWLTAWRKRVRDELFPEGRAGTLRGRSGE
jgi:hypothetical protein